MHELDGTRSRPHRRLAVVQGMLVAVILTSSLPGAALAEQASQPASAAAARLDVGRNHSCAVLAGDRVRCWGYGAEGQLGYANTATIGDDEAPGSVGPVQLGTGRTATAISAGGFHTCALLDDGSVRCWGYGRNGRLGYANLDNVGDDESPGSVEPVDLGRGRTATAISAGFGHTCALLDNGSVRCWGYGENGALGYADTADIGDDESPGSAGPVDLGQGRTATAISAGNDFTCAVLDDGSVRCWGLGLDGRLGYGNTLRVGDDETPGSVGPVDVGPERTAAAISAGAHGTCALLDDATVRCWGEGREGALGYGDGKYVGDNETPGAVGPVDIGAERTATAITAGRHTCAVLDIAAVRCWGPNARGQLGYANATTIGDTETPGSAGPVDLGEGRTATAVSVDESHTCARLDNGAVRCWGYGGNGRLGLCNERNIGDDESPAMVPPVALESADCPISGPTVQSRPPPRSAPGVADALSQALGAQAARLGGLRSCLSRVARHTRRELGRARHGSRSRRGAAKRHIKRHRAQLRGRCSRVWGRTPGRVTGLKARALSRRSVVLTFKAPGTDGSRPPAAHTYLVKESKRPIRTRRAFRRAPALCKGRCRFATVTAVGAPISLRVTHLRPRTTYYFAVVARDNVSQRRGPRGRAVRVRTP